MTSPKEQLEVVEYRVGQDGYRDVAHYDQARYSGPANEYKQWVMAQAYRRLIGPLHGKRILDVGCGTGRGVVEFGQEAAFAAGSDASLDMLRFAKQKVNHRARVGLAVAHAQRLPFADASFDVATALNFLHLFSLETQHAIVAELKRVVKPGGILVLEFDNALNGLLVGLYKRWRGTERGSLPGEIIQVIGDGCRVDRVYGAVFPIAWRVFRFFPRLFVPLEKVAYLPLLNRLSHRVYYRLLVETA